MSIRQGNNIIAGNTDGKKFNAYMTNCITEIPQDIKLETNTTFIIVKAGSKVYIPNGFEQDGTTPHFDTFTIPEDMSIGFMEGVSTRVILYDVTNEYINAEDLSLCSSGNTPPSSDGTWYDISTNRIKRYLNGSQDSVGFSLPLGIVKTDLIGRTSIDKEFNGFGYIGSTVFVLPGVKGLIPDGRNPDGTLKNIEHTTNKVSIRTISNANPYTELAIANTGSSGIGINNHYLNEKENYLYYSDGTKLNDRFVIGKISFSQTSPFNVTSFNTNTTFHAINYSEADFVISYQRPTAENNYTWYRLYKSGWVEQGGITQIPSRTNTGDSQKDITFPVSMNDSMYNAQISFQSGGSYFASSQLTFIDKATTGTKIDFFGNATGTIGPFIVAWEVKGFAEGY